MKRLAQHHETDTKRLMTSFDALSLENRLADVDALDCFSTKAQEEEESDKTSVCSEWPSSPHDSDSDAESGVRSRFNSDPGSNMWFGGSQPSRCYSFDEKRNSLPILQRLRKVTSKSWSSSAAWMDIEFASIENTKEEMGYQGEGESDDDEYA